VKAALHAASEVSRNNNLASKSIHAGLKKSLKKSFEW
jgi:hypothetical protein